MRHFFPKWNLISLNITHMPKHKVFLCALSCPPKPEPRTVENKEKKHKTRPALTRKSVIIIDYPWSSNESLIIKCTLLWKKAESGDPGGELERLIWPWTIGIYQNQASKIKHVSQCWSFLCEALIKAMRPQDDTASDPQISQIVYLQGFEHSAGKKYNSK